MTAQQCPAQESIAADPLDQVSAHSYLALDTSTCLCLVLVDLCGRSFSLSDSTADSSALCLVLVDLCGLSISLSDRSDSTADSSALCLVLVDLCGLPFSLSDSKADAEESSALCLVLVPVFPFGYKKTRYEGR